MKKLICFSLWGNDERYTLGAIRNAELAGEIYKDWTCKYYIGKNVPEKIIEKLLSFQNVIIKRIDNDGGWNKGTLWRFRDISNKDIDIMISRDVDSRLTVREKMAVDEWIKSDKGFHIMRDHPQHNTHILAGMFGCKRNIITNIDELIEKYQHTTNKQNDQEFLSKIVYSLIKDNVFTHDEFFEKKQFPAKRDEKHFVGQAYDGNDKILDAPEYFFDYLREKK